MRSGNVRLSLKLYFSVLSKQLRTISQVQVKFKFIRDLQRHTMRSGNVRLSLKLYFSVLSKQLRTISQVQVKFKFIRDLQRHTKKNKHWS